MNIKFKSLIEEDIEKLAPMMKRAFDYDSKIHLGEEEGGPDGYDNGDFLRKWGLNKDSTAFTVSDDGKMIGAVILWINEKTKENMLGNIFFDVSCQNKGYGEAVWKMIEEMYPDTKIWRTETPGFSRRNHYFYVMKCGFKIVRIENPKDIHEANYIFEKVIK